MADDVIFVKNGDELVPLEVGEYNAESALQELLAKHPQLLAGAQMNRSDPRRFLLVRREAPVSDHEGGGGRWSVDHLFLDQDATPTLVEVKRSSDTRIRREVVGQMLDYAANGTRYWAPELLRQLFEATCEKDGLEPSNVLGDVIGESDTEEFWTRAGRNLRRGAVRMVFVADLIPDELRSIIEFLNGQLMDAEVYGVEVRLYTAPGGQECYVPRLVGAVASAEREKSSTASTSLDELFAKSGSAATEIRDLISTWAGERGVPKVNAPGSFQVGHAKSQGGKGALARVYPQYGTIEIPLVALWEAGQDEEIPKMLARIQRIAPGKKLTKKAPGVPFQDALRNWDEVTAVLDSMLELRQDSKGLATGIQPVEQAASSPE